MEQKINTKLLETLEKNAADIHKCHKKFMGREQWIKHRLLCELSNLKKEMKIQGQQLNELKIV
jgi:hypothetical protein